ncbi:hypothetical protein V6N13_148159 [Hibiscus sabdariffa]
MLSTQPFPSPYPKPLLVDLHPLSAVCLVGKPGYLTYMVFIADPPHYTDMVDEISSLMDNLHFTEDETTDVPPLSNEEAEPDRDQETMLIGKILSTMLPDGDSFIRVFNSIWGTSILAIHMLQPHFFLFKFTNLASMAMIKHRGPGSFDGDMVAFTPFNPLLSLPELDFTRQLFWVRIYQLPLGLVDKC